MPLYASVLLPLLVFPLDPPPEEPTTSISKWVRGIKQVSIGPSTSIRSRSYDVNFNLRCAADATNYNADLCKSILNSLRVGGCTGPSACFTSDIDVRRNIRYLTPPILKRALQIVDQTYGFARFRTRFKIYFQIPAFASMTGSRSWFIDTCYSAPQSHHSLMPLLEAKRTGFSNPRSIGDIIYSADGDIPILPPM